MDPPWWARSGHAQTLWGHFLPSRAPRLIPGEDGCSLREVPLGDGDRLAVIVAGEGPVILHLFHGLSGDSDADYMRRTAAWARARGWGVAAVNHRGCGAGATLARRPYHAGRWEDLAAALRAGRARAPQARHLVVGFSLSGAMLLNLLAREEEGLVDGAVAVNPPLDLALGVARMHEGFNRIYERRFVRRLIAVVRARAARGVLPERGRIPRTTSLLRFDDEYTALEGGYGGAAEYYARCSPLEHVSAIRTPTVLLTALDDPLVPREPLEGLALGEGVELHVERHGGHLGYLCREPHAGGSRRWLDHALEHHLTRLARR